MVVFFILWSTLLNTPSILFETFPFIFLIASQLFFLNLQENDELSLLKITGVDNFSLIRLIIYISIILGAFITIFYTFSSNLKYNYLSIKNEFSNDNKYLAAINDNGLWIKDEIGDDKFVINADEFTNNILKNVTINQLDQDFNLKSITISDEANIENNEWKLKNARVFFNDGKRKTRNAKVNTNFHREKIKWNFFNLLH